MYIWDRRLSLRIHKGDVQSYDSTVASVIENNFSFFFLLLYDRIKYREREGDIKSKKRSCTMLIHL